MITPQPQQVVMVHQPQQSSIATSITQPFQVNPIQQNDDIATENYLYTGKVGDLTICHWLACLFCNCCFCGLIGLILNEIATVSHHLNDGSKTINERNSSLSRIIDVANT